MGRMSIAKGKRYERYVANQLSEWSGIQLVRTPDGTPEDRYADIWPKNVSEYFPLAVECKHEEHWSFDQLLKGTGPVFDWFEQAERQAVAASVTYGEEHKAALVFTKNRFPNLLGINSKCLWLNYFNFVWFLRLVLPWGCGDMPGHREYIIVNLEEFLLNVPYSHVYQSCREVY